MCLSSIETPCWLRDGNLILPDMAQPWDAGRLRQHGSGPACLLRTYMHISACIHAAQHYDFLSHYLKGGAEKKSSDTILQKL